MSETSSDDRRAWEQPGAFPVAPGVTRIPLPLPGDVLRAVNVYAIEDGDGIALIDAGQALEESRALLAEGLTTLGASFGDVRRILVTHAHRDHYTQAVTLRRAHGTPIALGEGEAESLRLLRDRTRLPVQSLVEQLEVCGATPLLELLALAIPHMEPLDGLFDDPDTWLDAQSRPLGSDRLQVVPTPGHTVGHVSYLDTQHGLLFAGDHVLPHITPSIAFEPVTPVLPLRTYLESLRLVRGMPDALLLPAHGPVSPSVHARVDELLLHHDHRLAHTHAALQSGAATPWEVAGLLRWTRHERQLADLDPLNQALATLECKAHLDLLVAQQRAVGSARDGVAAYAVVAPD